jgi:hypothetical protein
MAKDTKERILTTAPEMFSQKGYEGTNIRELSASLRLVKVFLLPEKEISSFCTQFPIII